MAKVMKDQDVYEVDKVDTMVSGDGKYVVLGYQVRGSEKSLPFGMSLEQAQLLHYQLGLLISASAGGPKEGFPGFVRMTNITAVDAGPTDEPDRVVLSLTTEAATVHHFSLPKELSAALRPRMRSAEASSVKGVQLPRA